MKVRAVVVTAPRSVEVRELELPAEPPRGGAVMRVVANGLCGSDYNLFNGKVAPMSEGLPVVPAHAVGPMAAVTPASIDYGQVVNGATTPDQQFSLRNTGR